MPPADTLRKPAVFHGLKVGYYLYQHDYPRDVVLAGVLHDAIEFADVTAEDLAQQFGANVAKLAQAILKYKPNDFTDPIFEKLSKILPA